MKILFIVPYVPSLVRVRPYNFIRFLCERGHQVTLATIWTVKSELDDIERIKPYCQRVIAHPLSRLSSYKNALAALPGKYPLQSVYSWDPHFAREIVDLIIKQDQSVPFDVVHVEHLRGARYGLYINQHAGSSRLKTAPPVVWDSVDNISGLFRQASSSSRRLKNRLVTRFEWPRTRRFEAFLVGQFVTTLVTSPRDSQEFLDLLPEGSVGPDIKVLPNGVDLDYFQPDAGVEREPSTLVISGKMSYHANISMCLDFVTKTMPLIWAKRPAVKLCLVGKDPPPEIRDLAKNPLIEVTGTVEDIRPYLRKGTLAVAPLTYGTGIQNKVLEAMACGTPVVTTAQAVSALKTTPGTDVIVANTPAELSRCVLGLLDHPEARDRLGKAGRRYVEKYHHWEDIIYQLEMIYQQARQTNQGDGSSWP